MNARVTPADIAKSLPVSLAWRERPFDGPLHHVKIASADRLPTIAQILAATDNLPRGFSECGEVRINGECVPRERWSCVRPRPFAREIAITLHMPLRQGGGAQGSGGAQKNTGALIATIAVLLIAAAVSGGALGPAGLGLLGSGFAAGGIGASLAGAGIGIAGSLAVAALFPPPSLSPNQQQQTATPDTPQANTPASLTGNALAPGAAVPRVIGTMRVFPPLLCAPLVELIGDIEYAEAVFGLAGPHQLTVIEADGVDISTIPELSIEIQDGTASAPTQSLVGRQGYTVQPNLTLSAHKVDPTNTVKLANQANPDDACPQWNGLITRNSPDELWLTVAWAQGLFDTTGVNAQINEAIRVRLRPRGSVTWINCPEVHFSSNVAAPFARDIRIKWGLRPVAPSLPPTQKGPIYAFKHVPGQDGSTTSPVTAAWDADASFSAGAGNDLLSAATVTTSNLLNTELYQEKAIFYLDPSVFPKGLYEIQVMRSSDYIHGNFTASTYSYSNPGVGGLPAHNGVQDFFRYQTDNGVFQLAVDNGKFYDAATITRVASVWNENPIESTDFATISVRIHNRALGQLSVLASGYVNDWDGIGWNTQSVTSNPAPHFRDILGGTMGASPLPTAIIDDAGLVTWRSACTALGYECNAVLEGKTYIDALNLVARSGYANLRNSETWGVILDRDRAADVPVQIFTPRNMASFSWTKPFSRLPTGFRAAFTDRDNNYVPNEIVVFTDPAKQDATTLESIQYDGLVTTAEVEARAAFDLLQAQLRLTFYSGVCDFEALVCQRGDLVGVQHDILSAQAGFARIKSVTASGGNITGLALEGSVPVDQESGVFSSPHMFPVQHLFKLGSRTGAAIRLKGGNGVIIKEITAAQNGESDTVSFVTPFPDPGLSQLDVDCLCAVGPLGSEFRRLLVYSIMPKDDITATVTFVDEAPELWSGATGRLGTDSGSFISTDDGSLVGIGA